jgi:hypothetical protein
VRRHDVCTTIAEKVPLSGSGKGADGWFELTDLYVTYDHPFHAPHEHALSVSFVNEAAGGRVAVELDRANARVLVDRLLAALERADQVEGASLP